MSVFVFVNEQSELVISSDSKSGEPCLCIPLKQESVFMWLSALIQAADNGELEADLPGCMAVITSEEDL